MPPKKRKSSSISPRLNIRPLGESGNGPTPTPATPSVDLDELLESDSKKYSKKELKQHILDLPDTYIGSVVSNEVETWVYQEPVVVTNEKGNTPDVKEDTRGDVKEDTRGDAKEDTKSDGGQSTLPGPLIVQQKINIPMGLFKIIDEILQNAADNVPRTRKYHQKDSSVELTTQIKVSFEEDHSIIVQNNGEGIPIVEHVEHKVLIPTMIFGELLTSGNYDKMEERRWGGRNGVGSKVANIYSSEFIVETVDRIRQKKFVQKWSKNMSDVKPAKVTSFTGKPYTRITFKPDYARFGCQGLSSDMKALLIRRVYDLAGTTGASVFLNGKKLAVRHFQHFTELFLDKTAKRVYECIYENQEKDVIAWEVVACPSPDGTFRQVSYVNFVSTFQGGRHVDYMVYKITKKLCDMVNDKMTKAQTPIQQKHLKNNLWLFVNASVVNPSFSSQTKEYLTTAITQLPPCELSDSFYAKLVKSDVVERAKLLKDFQEQKLLTKTDGKKVKTISGIPKLEDANQAGGKYSRKCKLIVCEGDSARSFAISGLGVVGREYYGVYPLKGKPMNVREETTSSVTENKEIQELKKILGLREGIKSLDELRYGELMILTDEDVDGIHIKALIMNLFEVYWKDIMKSGFMVSMYTPLVKLRRGKTVVATFYNEYDFEVWKSKHDLKGLDVRYYKGLGTHDATEARECFKSLQTIRYTYDEKTSSMLQLGFDKKHADQRKAWIAQHQHQPLDYKAKEVKISEFIDNGLILFSNADNIRSIPSFMDGFKPSQRKVMCGVLRKNQTSSIKISQLVGPISSSMAYHHGEKSLESTIVNMAQNFVGANNINLLNPEGQFGTRLKGGYDAASSRYIFTSLEPVARKIFRKEDDPLLTHRMEDGKQVEPDFYLPVIPMLLVNGSAGIGTGFSTNVPNHNPMDIIHYIRDFLQSTDHNPSSRPTIQPWYRKFKGQIINNGGQWCTMAQWTRKGSVIRITELPVGIWTDDYKEYLDKITIGRVESVDTVKSKSKSKSKSKPRTNKRVPCVVKYKIGNFQDEQSVDFTVEMDKEYPDDEVITLLKLSESKTCNTNNMHAFDPYGHLVKFPTPTDLLQTFCEYRLHFYESRRQYLLRLMSRDMKTLEERIRFIEGVISKTLVILDQPKKDMCATLKRHNFLPNPSLTAISIPPVSAQSWISASDPHVVKNELYSRDYSSELLTTPTKQIMENYSEESAESGELSQYQYLVSTSVFHMSREEIVRLKADYARKKTEVVTLQSQTAKDLWEADLNELEIELKSSQGSN
jgi:DNA topoisomerase-2